ncbi:glycosyltransferase [Acuticoccus sp. M5D2P5]|uniref:glycosyltransferase n=1 Tax=Acuticoccus kalidii TaxID=2910977 RepID=UPI001F26316F|nr:glycosyltransferase [Acuticoccus kalidii]MCF3933689.1 glycosyltransferase [Acuticoccus kalidii]
MKIVAFAVGTRGDVEPQLAIADALMARGHDVRLAVPSDQVDWVEASGVPTIALPYQAKSLLNSPEIQKAISSGRIIGQVKTLIAKIKGDSAATLEAIADAAEGADAMITMQVGMNLPAAVAAVRRIPILPITLFPWLPTRAFPCPMATTRSLGPLNRASYDLVLRQLARGVKSVIDPYRMGHGLAATKAPFAMDVVAENRPAAIAWSRHIVPMPGDYGGGAFQPGAIVAPPALRDRTGSVAPSPALLDWIARGDAPIFFSFGSMAVPDEAATVALLQRALKDLGMRGILSTGWSSFSEGEHDDLFSVRHVDHQRLFPHCVATVHHGGAGTTHASTGAGLPTLVTSFTVDQPFWGERLKRIGVGDHVRFKALTRESLVAHLGPLLSAETAARAKRLGEAMAEETALADIVRYVEEALPGTPPPN